MNPLAWLTQSEEPAEAVPAKELTGQVIEVLRTLYDPEIPVNIYDLGLIYGLDVNAVSGKVQIRLTLTAPGCPVAQTFPELVRSTVSAVPGVIEVNVELVWEPRWSRAMMSEAALLELGLL